MSDQDRGAVSLLSRIPLAPRNDDSPSVQEQDRPVSPDLHKTDGSKNASRSTSAKQKSDDRTDDFNNDEIQQKMNGVISTLQTRPITPDQASPLATPHEKSSTDTEQLLSKEMKTTTDESLDQTRPTSFPLEQTQSLDINSEDDFFRPRAAPNDEIRPPSHQSNQNGLDETRHFGVNSPKAAPSGTQSPHPPENSSRAPSRLSKHSTVLDQETPREKEARAPSARDSRRNSPDQTKAPPLITNHSRKSSSNENFLSTNNDDQHTRLIKPGEQLQIPTDAIENERNHSPPPMSSAIRDLVSINPLNAKKESEKVDAPSSPKRKKSNASASGSVASRRSSQAKEQPATKSSHSRQASQASATHLFSRQQSEEKVVRRPSQESLFGPQPDDKPTHSRKASQASAAHLFSRQQSEEKVVRRPSQESLFGPQPDDKPASKTASRKNSSSEAAKIPSSRRESEQKLDTNRSVKSTSSRHSSIVQADAPEKSSRRSSSIKIAQPIAKSEPEAPANADTDRSSRPASQRSKKELDLKLDLTPLEQQSKAAKSKDSERSTRTESGSETPKASKPPSAREISRSPTPTEVSQGKVWTQVKEVASTYTTDDDMASARDIQDRPKSPNAQQIDERNQIPPMQKRKSTDGKKKRQNGKSLVRSTSADSFSGIPIVDDQSIGSNSEKNEEIDRKKRPIRSKTKDMETNTEPQDVPPKKTKKSSSKSGKTETVKASDDSDPVNVNVTVLVKKYSGDDDETTTKKKPTKEQKSPSPKPAVDHERHTQSDTEQVIPEKQKKRRRPKRISRTTQTYEAVFRRMAEEQHQELEPVTETDKSIQTRRSQLRPKTRSPRRQLPLYLSTDAFRVEEILPKQFPQTQRNASKVSMVARSTSPPPGKILILRPTLPIHHSDAVNVQRVCLQYAIDLVPKDATNRSTGRLNPLQQLEQTKNLPAIRSPSSSSVGPSNHRPVFRDKPVATKTDQRSYQPRRNGGAV